MPTFLTPIDHSNLELRNALLQNLPTVSLPSTNRAGQILYDSTLNLPAWNHGAGFYYIYRPSITHITSTITAVIRDASGNFAAGTITAALAGNASTATKLFATKNIGISGTKVTATAAAFDGSADVNINITALSVAAGDIALTNESFIVGNGSNVGAVTAKSAIPLSGFGAATAHVAMGGFKITGLAEPTSGQDAATKNYVDATAQGLDVKLSVRVATTGNLNATYASQNLTNGSTAAPLVIDGISMAVGDRVLVRSQTDAKQNGIYFVSVVGTASVNWVLVRAVDFNTSADITPGAFTFVEEGNTLADTGWVMTADGVITLDTSNLTWAQFSGAGSYSGGRGIVLTGNSFHFAQSTAYTTGDLPYATGASTIGLLAAVATGNVLISAGTGTAPAWGKVGLATHVSGTLPVANGGTGAISVTNNGVAIGSGGNYAFTAAASAGQFLVANASGVPTFVALSGDATLSNAGSLTIAGGAVTFAKFQPVAGLSVVGVTGAAQATTAPITGAANQVLRVDPAANSLAFGAINIASSAAVTGTLAISNGGTGLAAVGLNNQSLISNGTAAAWGFVSLTAGVSGILPSGFGGTGSAYAQFTTGGSAIRTYSLRDQNCQIPAHASGNFTGTNVLAAFSATHNLNTKNVVASLYDSSDNQVFTDVQATTVNAVTFTFAVAPASGTTYRWVVVGY